MLDFEHWIEVVSCFVICSNSGLTPTITSMPGSLKYNQVFTVKFTVKTRRGGVATYQRSAPFTTHSFSQGQRMLSLKTTVPTIAGTEWTMQVTSALNSNVAPPAYYMIFVVQNGIPSRGKWVKQTN